VNDIPVPRHRVAKSSGEIIAAYNVDIPQCNFPKGEKPPHGLGDSIQVIGG
jgi:hypothetical protein